MASNTKGGTKPPKARNKKRPPNIVNTDALKWVEGGDEIRFECSRKSFTHATNGEKLGCSLYRVEPGMTAFPFHLHHGNEEAIFILSGEGTLRLGAGRHAVGPGDYIALPAGREAHQLLNEGADLLEYLCFSTMIQPEVMEYPDSGKVGAIAGAPPGGDKTDRNVFGFYKRDSAVDYYEGE